MRKCIIAPDSFKGSMGANEVCDIIEERVREAYPDCRTVSLPVADGGEGTVDCFLRATGGERVELTVRGPFGEAVKSFYGRTGGTAIIEMAAAAGLPLAEGHLNPLTASTYGVGELIRHALENGAKRVVLGMGGSATNDAGCGCAAALGAVFRDKDGAEFVPAGGTLDKVASIDIAKVKKLLSSGVEFTAMCDVENPMHGETGAAYIFGPQKGATAEMVRLLDANLKALDTVLQSDLGKNIAHIPGTGAAGALGAGVMAFFDAKLRSGITTALEISGFDENLEGADLVVTGEGRIDAQSLRGKVVNGIAERAKKRGVPVLAIVGDVGEGAEGAYDRGVTAIFSINRVAVPFTEARLRSKSDLSATMKDIMRLMRTPDGMVGRLL